MGDFWCLPIRNWWVRALPFYPPYCSFPNRSTKLYRSQCSLDADNLVSFNEQVSSNAQARIKAAVAKLQAEDTLPQGVTARSHLITQEAKCSRRTLYKYLELWHPDHLPELEDGTNGITGVSEIQSESLDASENKAIAHSSTASANLVPTPPYKKVGGAANAVAPLGQHLQLDLGVPLSLKNQSKIDPSEQQRQSIDLNEAKTGIEIVNMSGAIAKIQVCFLLLKWGREQVYRFFQERFAQSSMARLSDGQLLAALSFLQREVLSVCSDFKGLDL